jgi:hypothetical protein
LEVVVVVFSVFALLRGRSTTKSQQKSGEMHKYTKDAMFPPVLLCICVSVIGLKNHSLMMLVTITTRTHKKDFYALSFFDKKRFLPRPESFRPYKEPLSCSNESVNGATPTHI